MRDDTAVVGIDIGGTKIAAALFGYDGQIILREIRQLDGRTGHQVSDLAIEMSNDLLQDQASKNYRVKAIGACVPGIYHPVQKSVWAPNIPLWHSFPLHEELSKGIGDSDLPILIESDRSCHILGEVWKGKAQGCENAIFITVGTGIGAGILSNGQLITGKSGVAGAVGWLALDPPFDEKYKSCGNFEYYASGDGIARSAVEKLKDTGRESVQQVLLPVESITSHKVFDAYARGDTTAIQVIDKAILYWGMAVANLVSIFNPEMVIFGGGIFGPAAELIDRILLESKKWAQPISMSEVSFHITALRGDAGLIGAGYLALKSLQTES